MCNVLPWRAKADEPSRIAFGVYDRPSDSGLQLEVIPVLIIVEAAHAIPSLQLVSGTRFRWAP